MIEREYTISTRCGVCLGAGIFRGKECPECVGTGRVKVTVKETARIDPSIPAPPPTTWPWPSPNTWQWPSPNTWQWPSPNTWQCPEMTVSTHLTSSAEGWES
jgi:hypothetical protein